MLAIGRLLLVLLLSQDRPGLPAGLDTNDWISYQGQGLKEIENHPEVALRYFAFAARLDPSVAEPLLGEYAAWWRLHKKLQNRLWEHPDRALSDSVQADSVLAAERWRDEADLRNPFATQAVLTWAAPKRILLNPWDPFQLGLAAFFRSDWNQTILWFSDVVGREPDSLGRTFVAYRYRALALAHVGRWDDAANDIDTLLAHLGTLEQTKAIPKAIPWDLGKARLYYTAALMRLADGDHRQARTAFEHALELDLGFPMAHVYYGNLLIDEGDTAKGLREYAMAADLHPTDAFIRQNYGAILFNLGRYDSSLVHLTEAVRLAPDFAVLYFNRAICLEVLGRTDEARAMHQQFVARAPRRMKPLIQQSESFLARQPK